MNITDIILKKENNEILTKEEIDYVVFNYMSGVINDEDMTLLLKTICKNGMSFDETYDLTISMLNSGDILDLSKIDGTIVDKHSTGGVGDKTTLVVLPIAAACGVKMAKMSGRSLGFTGGTIDKLESIPGFNVNIPFDEFIEKVNKNNIALVSQSGNLVPADKKIYALRDVTGTAKSIPLIASSIMSKKLAANGDKILLDVKVGKGAFMDNIDDARELAKTMVEIGKKHNKETVAVLTNMDYPLGYTIGNSIEVVEAINTLRGRGEKSFTNLCLFLASYIVALGKDISIDDAVTEVKKVYKNRDALHKFKEFISSQGGNINGLNVCDDCVVIISDKEGYVTDMDTMTLANLCNSLGAGRINKDDVIDHSVGIELLKQINDKVEVNEPIMVVYTSDSIDEELYRKTITIAKEKIDKKMIYEVIK